MLYRYAPRSDVQGIATGNKSSGYVWSKLPVGELCLLLNTNANMNKAAKPLDFWQIAKPLDFEKIVVNQRGLGQMIFGAYLQSGCEAFRLADGREAWILIFDLEIVAAEDQGAAMAMFELQGAI